MKKYLSIIMALIMALSLCACNNDDNDDPTLEGSSKPSQSTDKTTDSSSTPTGSSSNVDQFKGKLVESTMKLIASENYMYELKDMSSGTTYSYAIAGSKALVTLPVEGGSPVSIIKMNGKCYIVLASESAYGELTESVASKFGLSLSEIMKFFDAADLSILLSCSYKGNGTTTLENQTYNYEDYYNPILQHTRRFYFDQNNTLKYMSIVGGTDGDKLVSLSVYTATSSVFDVINSYQLVDLSNAK